MVPSRFLKSFLSLTVVVVSLSPFAQAANPQNVIKEHPEFYPFSENETLNTFGGTLRLNYVDFKLPGNGLDIEVQRVYQIQPFVKQDQNKYKDHKYAVYEWSQHFGRIYQTVQTARAGSGDGNFLYESAAGNRQSLYWNGERAKDNKIQFKTTANDKVSMDLGRKQFELIDSTGTKTTFIQTSSSPEYYEPESIVDVNGYKLQFTYKTVQLDNYSQTKLDKVVGCDANGEPDGREVFFEYENIENHAYLTKVKSYGRAVIYQYMSNKNYQLPKIQGHPTQSGPYMLYSALLPDGSETFYSYIKRKTGDNKLDFEVDGEQETAPLLSVMTLPTGAHIEYSYDALESAASDLHYNSMVSRRAVDNKGQQFSHHGFFIPNTEDAQFTLNSEDETISYVYNMEPKENALYLYGTLKDKFYFQPGSGEVLRAENYEWAPFTVSKHPSSLNKVKDKQTQIPLLKQRDVTMNGRMGRMEFKKPDEYGFAQEIIESGSKYRVTEISYKHIKDKHIIGLTEKVILDGGIILVNEYDDYGRLRYIDDHGYMSENVYKEKTGLLWGHYNKRDKVVAYDLYFRGIPEFHKNLRGDEVHRRVNYFGNIVKETNPRGYTKHFKYDALNRVTEERPYKAFMTTHEYNKQSKDSHLIKRGPYEELRLNDGFGRPTKIIRKDTHTGKTYYETILYNTRGQETFHSFPSENDNPTEGRFSEYDGLGRLTRTSYPTNDASASVERTLYNENITHIDANENTTTTYTDFYADPLEGEVKLIKQPEGVTTEVTWDNEGRVKKVKQGRFVRSYDYNWGGCLISETHPELGLIEYERDKNCNMTRKFVNGRFAGGFLYNENDNLFNATFDDSHMLIIRRDQNDNIREAGYKRNNWSYTYDANDNLITEVIDIDKDTDKVRFKHEYDGLGNRTKTYYPSGEVIDYAPNAFGQPTKLGRFLDNIEYTASGQLKSVTNLAGISTVLEYNSRRLPIQLQAANILDLVYDYDKSGNTESITDNLDPDYSASMTYDGMHRLKTINGKWGAGNYKYDAQNNITERVLGDKVTVFNYNDKNRLESVTGVYQYQPQYDKFANITQKAANEPVLAYDLRNHVEDVKAEGLDIHYEYDGNENRLLTINNGNRLLSLHDRDGRLIYEKDLTNNLVKESYYLDDRLVATNDNGELNLYYWNVQGDVVASTDANGALLWKKAYQPFGLEIRQEEAANEPRGFSAKEFDKDTGLNYFGGRFYAPELGRFMSPDPAPVKAGEPFTFNRYIYGNNNPYKYNDPDGRMAVQIIGGLIGGGTGLVTSWIRGDSWTDTFKATAVGAGVGVLSTIPGGLATTMAVGAGTNAASDAALKAWTGHADQITTESVATSAGIGAFGGALGGLLGKVSVPNRGLPSAPATQTNYIQQTVRQLSHNNSEVMDSVRRGIHSTVQSGTFGFSYGVTDAYRSSGGSMMRDHSMRGFGGGSSFSGDGMCYASSRNQMF